MSNAVWVSRETFLTLWHGIRNISVRMDRTVMKPSVTFSGSGAAARIRIDLPSGGPGGDGTKYTGSFAVTQEAEDGKPPVLRIGKGYVNVNGTFFTVSGQTVSPQEGILCVTAYVDETERKITDPVFEFHEPDASHYPIAQITLDDDGNYKIRQYPVTVAVILLTKPCIFAKAATQS